MQVPSVRTYTEKKLKISKKIFTNFFVYTHAQTAKSKEIKNVCMP